MTEKEQILAEIIKMKKLLEDKVEEKDFIAGEVFMLNYLHSFINSMKEEPLSEDEIEKQFKVGDVVVYVSRHPAYSGLYILGNPNDLSIGYTNANEPYGIALRNCTIASEDDRNQFMRELNSNGYKWNNGTLRIEKVEPVSEDLDKAANEWDRKASFQPIHMVMDGNRPIGTKQHITTHADSFKAGAEWMKQQMMKNAVDGEVTYGKSLAIPLLGYRLDKEGLDFGDKVKLIIIKKDKV